MPTATTRTALHARLESMQRQGGNWRLRGLLLALSEQYRARDLGRAWPRQRPRTDHDYLHLGARHSDTYEHGVARTLYDADAVREGETVPRDEYISRALASESHTELDVLWREELLETVQAGAATRKIARAATTVTEVNARKGDLTIPGQQPFADTSAEDAAGGFDEEDYSQASYDCEKFTQGFAIEEELIEQAEVAQVERQIEAAGMAIENAINRQHAITVVDNANQDHDVGANEAVVQDVLEAMENVTDNDFDPANVLILHPELRTELADDPALGILDFSRFRADDESDRELQETPTQAAQRALGPQVFVHSGATYNGLSTEPSDVGGSNTWGWEADGEIGGAVYGSPFVHTALYEDVTVTELGSPVTDIRDIAGGVARAYSDCVLADTNAVSTITQ